MNSTPLLAPNDYSCRLRPGLLAAGFGVILSTVISKNLLVARMFGEKKVQKPANEQLKFRALNAALLILEVILITIWSQLSSFKYLNLSTGNEFYVMCKLNKDHQRSVVASAVLFYYNLVLAISLLPTLYCIQFVHWEQFNESSLLIVIFVLIGITYGVVQNELSFPTFESDFKIGVCIWIATTVVLYAVLGLKLTKLLIMNKGIEDITKLRSNSFAEGSMSKYHRKSVKKSRASTLVQLDQFSYYHKVLNNTLDYCTFKFTRGKYGRWSYWLIGQPELHILRGRVWISLYSPRQIPCFCITLSTQKIITKTMLKLSMGSDVARKESTASTVKDRKSKNPEVQYDLIMEFESVEKASAFLAELTSAIDQFGVPRTSRVLESKLNDLRRQSESRGSQDV
ncbi:hypothetical protein BCR33DRAFT_330260 [Rhizoclosmatium globosum]|uniref:G-protein coupled receptors family 3 profile domain-containing protein n=1 Tax=Rhizoclosmatium globosum TaxID=329046 RepID=A0A1Y2C6V5_9FUNG|nr:hypothetical protein BCR33DRAFT_330260 [Rhizoclosmatium globosum]|eukprot:ORY42035.1 hypothetical protein BCR33DRAFT_330260 [Rhizoclosmatium globosum]